MAKKNIKDNIKFNYKDYKIHVYRNEGLWNVQIYYYLKGGKRKVLVSSNGSQQTKDLWETWGKAIDDLKRAELDHITNGREGIKEYVFY
jgi:hypothetical protein